MYSCSLNAETLFLASAGQFKYRFYGVKDKRVYVFQEAGIIKQGFMQVKLLFLCSLAFFLYFGFAEEKYYYCHSYSDQRMSAFDRMVEVSQGPSGNMLHTYMRSREPLLRTYNETNKIIAVYKDHYLSNYKSNALQFIIFELDVSKNTLTRYLVYHNMSIKDFEYSYQISFSKETLRQYNRNPEVLKYIPAEPAEKGNFSYAYAKNPMKCRSLSYLGYLRDSILLALIQILSAG